MTKFLTNAFSRVTPSTFREFWDEAFLLSLCQFAPSCAISVSLMGLGGWGKHDFQLSTIKYSL